jgi:hypothetical protein
MKAPTTIGLFVVLMATLAGIAPTPAQETKSANAVNSQQAEEDLAFALGVEAYIWSYPLMMSGATAEVATATDKPLPNGRAPFNTFGHAGRLMTATDKDVVSPNADTVYSSAFVDLKQGAALISVPGTGDRYYSFMLEDAYTNVFGYIGSRATGSSAGKYLLVGPGWKGETPAGAKVIQAPTPLVWIIVRTLVDGPQDMPNVAAIQKQYQLTIVPPATDPTPIKQRWNLTLQPKLVPVQQVDTLDWKTYFYWAGQLMKDNPPPAADSALVTQFESIGLSAKSGFDVTKLSPAKQRGLERGYGAAGRS